MPRHLQLSRECQDFIRKCLQKIPSERIKIDKILSHDFFQLPFPKLCPMSTLFQAPKEVKLSSDSNQI